MALDMNRSEELRKVPLYNELLNPVLKSLNELGGSASIDELFRQIISDLQLSPDVVQVLHGKGNRSELEYRLAWARTYLKKFGLINNSERGVWSLTSKGANVESVDPNEVVLFVRQQGRISDQADSPQSVTLIESEDLNEDSTDEIAHWREVLMDALLGMTPDSFERLCRRVLRESGFIEVEVTGRSGDGGIDGNGIIRLAGLISFPVLFQCKRYSGNVGASTVRDFRGAMIGRADKGLVITTGGFTRDAHAEATRDGAPPIDLIDGELLMSKLKELSLGVSTRMVEVVDIERDWFKSI